MHSRGEKKRKSSSEGMSQKIEIKNGQLRIDNFLSSPSRNFTPKKNEEIK